MKTVELRRRLCLLGFTMEDEKNGLFHVTNGGPGKRAVEHEFKTLEAVETWVRMLEGGKGK